MIALCTTWSQTATAEPLGGSNWYEGLLVVRAYTEGWDLAFGLDLNYSPGGAAFFGGNMMGSPSRGITTLLGGGYLVGIPGSDVAYVPFSGALGVIDTHWGGALRSGLKFMAPHDGEFLFNGTFGIATVLHGPGFLDLQRDDFPSLELALEPGAGFATNQGGYRIERTSY